MALYGYFTKIQYTGLTGDFTALFLRKTKILAVFIGFYIFLSFYFYRFRIFYQFYNLYFLFF